MRGGWWGVRGVGAALARAGCNPTLQRLQRQLYARGASKCAVQCASKCAVQCASKCAVRKQVCCAVRKQVCCAQASVLCAGECAVLSASKCAEREQVYCAVRTFCVTLPCEATPLTVTLVSCSVVSAWSG